MLSGLVLSLGFFKRRGDYTQLCPMLIKRIPRLSIPIFVMGLIVLILMKAGLFFNIPAGRLIENIGLAYNYNFQPSLPHLLKFSFFDVYFQYDLNTSYNVNLWTIGWEIRGSIVSALVLICCYQVRARAVPFLILVALFTYLANPYYLVFLTGMVLAYIYTNRQDIIEKFKRSVILRILLILVFIISYLSNIFFIFAQMEHAMNLSLIVTTFLLIFICFTFRFAEWFYSCRLSRFLGAISYPLFITHYVVICTFSSYLILNLWEPGNDIVIIYISFWTFVVSIAVAAAFYPIEKLSMFAAQKLFQYVRVRMPKPAGTAGAPVTAPQTAVAAPIAAAVPSPAAAPVSAAPADPAPAKTRVKAKEAKTVTPEAPATAAAPVPAAPEADDDVEDPAFSLVQKPRDKRPKDKVKKP
jgi:peptidoglycan/LPS O-acetylase OafA/YrhL